MNAAIDCTCGLAGRLDTALDQLDRVEHTSEATLLRQVSGLKDRLRESAEERRTAEAEADALAETLSCKPKPPKRIGTTVVATCPACGGLHLLRSGLVFMRTRHRCLGCGEEYTPEHVQPLVDAQPVGLHGGASLGQVAPVRQTPDPNPPACPWAPDGPNLGGR